MNESRTILVLGGGVGGLIAATTLRKKLGKRHRIVLVDREETHLFAPSLLWLMTGERTARQIVRPLERLSRRGIDVVRGAVERIDPELRQISVGGRELRGDFLVISLGADFAPNTVPGLAESGHNFYTLAGAEGFRDAFARVDEGRLVLLTAGPAYKCPAAPYEAAMLVESALRKRRVRDAVKLSLFAAEPGPMGVAGPEVSKAVKRMLEVKGIEYHPEHQIVRVEPATKLLAFANGSSASFDLLFAIGDVTAIPLKLGKPLPKAGVFAHGQAEVVASNIVRAITGKGKPASFDGHGECFIEAGDGEAGFGVGNFYAEPVPEVKLHEIGRRWHAAKLAFEKIWLARI